MLLFSSLENDAADFAKLSVGLLLLHSFIVLKNTPVDSKENFCIVLCT